MQRKSYWSETFFFFDYPPPPTGVAGGRGPRCIQMRRSFVGSFNGSRHWLWHVCLGVRWACGGAKELLRLRPDCSWRYTVGNECYVLWYEESEWSEPLIDGGIQGCQIQGYFPSYKYKRQKFEKPTFEPELSPKDPLGLRRRSLIQISLKIFLNNPVIFSKVCVIFGPYLFNFWVKSRQLMRLLLSRTNSCSMASQFLRESNQLIHWRHWKNI